MHNKPPNNPKKTFEFAFDASTVYFSSEFECGNLGIVTQLDPLTYSITGQTDVHSTVKSCLYFSVKGFPIGSRVKFRLWGISILGKFYDNTSKSDTSYQFCVRRGEADWERMLEGTNLEMQDKQYVLSFSYTFWANSTYEFAFNYPYGYEKLERYLAELTTKISDLGIYYDNQVLAKSRQGRDIRLITISNNGENSLSKPVIMVTARVHPSQSPSSFIMQGLLDFLLNPEDLRSHLLRETFTIMVIPMLNPDGVALGNFRYDDIGQNLNRFYLDPSPQYQPSIHATRKIMSQITSRIVFYFDLHAHHSPKGCFIYGNTSDDFARQVETRAFCKVMSINNCDFEYQSCNHKQDGPDKLGCGRMFAHKIAKALHSYTVECGYYRGLPNQPTKQSNTQHKVGQLGFTDSPNNPSRIYTPCNYREVGRDLLISVLDVLELNPYSKVTNSEFREMDALRRILAVEIYREEGKRAEPKKIRAVGGVVLGMYEGMGLIKKREGREGRDYRGEVQEKLRASTQLKRIEEIHEQKPLVVKEEKKDNSTPSSPVNNRNTRPVHIQSISTKIPNTKNIRSSFTPIPQPPRYSEAPTSPSPSRPPFSRSQIKLLLEQSPQKTKQPPKKLVLRRLKTTNQIQVVRNSVELGAESRLEGRVEELRREIIVGRQNSLLKAYENAKKKNSSTKAQHEKKTMEGFRLPKLEHLLEAKTRIIQQCRLEYILNPGKFK